ncbi:hypothetical protein [Oleiharenicola lentus]|uniref:hypothetical protein n=1 Tax=Oleiharenicola lentus TaxID=2508720 RepID=UPI003F66B58A
MATLLALLGFGVGITGLVMPLYHDQAKFDHLYRSIDPKVADASESYANLRTEFLTPSIKFQDYGVTCALFAGLILAASNPRKVMACWPVSWLKIASMGALAAGVVTGAFIGSLFLDAIRGEFPWWADSLGIPLMGAPFIFLAFLIWALFNAGMLAGQWGAGVKCWQRIRKICVLAAVVVLSGLFLFSAVQGDFWGLVSVVPWLCFYTATWKAIRSRDSQIVKATEN